MTTISLRIPDELNNILEKISKQQERSKTFIVKKAIENYLEDLTDYNLAEEGYKRYLADNKKGYNLKEVAKSLGIKMKDLE